MSTETRNAVIAALASLHAGVDKDEAVAKAAAEDDGTDWFLGPAEESDERTILYTGPSTLRPGETWDYPVAGKVSAGTAAHIARHDPARARREVTAMRSLVAAIVAEPHAYIPGDSWYSCSQAVVPDPADDEDRVPGSGCMDDTRRGQPCDCGRDARAGRLLGILAGIYDGTGEQQR